MSVIVRFCSETHLDPDALLGNCHAAQIVVNEYRIQTTM